MKHISALVLSPVLAAVAGTTFLFSSISARADIVINEVLHDSEPNTACNEFIELYNSGPAAENLSGWFFSDGIDFTFPNGTMLNSDSYVVVAQDPPSVLASFGTAALGPWSGGLRNEGETIALRNAGGELIDEVTYKDSFPWPVGATGTGRSMELINPGLDNDLGSSWRATQPPPVLGELTYFSEGGAWSYRKGTSAPPADWNTRGFVEGAEWLSGQTPIGFGNASQVLGTALNDMQSNYSSVYARKTFSIAAGEIPQSLLLRHNVDDGFIAYINGVEVANVRANGAGNHDDTASGNQSPEGSWAEIEVTAGATVEGENVLAIVAYNSLLTGSDFAFDFELIRPDIPDPEKVPTPGGLSSAFASNAPPNIRQVDHSPKQPTTSESAVITAKVTDPDGVASVSLEYQVVQPGAYIPALLAKTTSALLSNPTGPRDPNPAYNDPANWTTVAMLDDGTGGDAVTGDDIYSVTLPAQVNRALVRYRITVEDAPGASVRVPFEDDPSLNFAYFVYNGVPDFIAGTRSVTGQVPYTHPKEVLTSLPVYTMLTTQANFDQCVAYNSGDRIGSNNFDARSAFNWGATFVYNGVVYDNIAYRLRQRNDRYGGGGKRSFRFRFNDGKYIQLHDLNGDPYPTKWRSINSHKMTGSRGSGANFGLFETTNSLLWNLIGSPAPFTHWFHFRVVKGSDEQPAGANGQHLGDFYGLLTAMEDYDVRFLEAHNLERGNLYKLKTGGNNGLSVQRYQAKGAVDDASDFLNIINQLRNTKSDQWLRDHVNWESWYRYHAIIDAVRHYDVSNGITTNNGEHLKNRSYWFEPDPNNPLGKLHVLPWDADTTWGFNWNGGWDWPKNAMNDREEFNKEYKNVVREIRDLVWQEDQLIPLIESFEKKLTDFSLADRDRWTGGTGTPNPGSQSDGPIANRTQIMKNFAFIGGSWSGGNDAMRDFIYNASGTIVASDSISKDSGISGQEGRDAYLDALAFDPSVPDKPTITYTGDAGFPTDGISFQASAFSDPQGAGTFSAMEWRVAEVTPIGGGTVNFFDAGQDWKYLDDGSNQGSAWRDQNFDDGSWSTGPAPMGYGGITGTVIATTLDFGGNPSAKYITTYFRRTVNVPNPDLFETFTFKMHVDDGALVFVNGVEVVRDGFDPNTTVNFDTLADDNGNEGAFDDFLVPSEAFVAGMNTIAVELHQSGLSSSDLGFDMALEATERTIPAGASLLFEWNASWKSGELATQQTQIDVPVTATRESRLYRARVRYKDNTERWSNWSDPLDFTTTLPDIQPLLDNLVISEFMYHPSSPTASEVAAGFTDQDEFEYVEVQNVSQTETLLLTDVRFTKGIDFDFAPGTTLAPGAYLLVVRNQAAFEFRYGAGLPVAGEYQANAEANLSNSGEQLKLSFGGGTPIRDLVFDDVAPWPAAADGTGPSLVLVNPTSVPDHALAQNWMASVVSGGSPGTAEQAGQTFASWLATFGIVDTTPDLDSDLDGLTNLLEFGLAGNPIVSGPNERPTGEVMDVAGEDYLTITFRRPTNAAGISHAVEFSQDLNLWAADGVMVSSAPGAGNTVIEVWRSAAPISGDAKMFGRVRVTE